MATKRRVVRRVRALPTLPYPNPIPNSGWSGTDTSLERALWRDDSGATAGLQAWLLDTLAESGPYGHTIAELRPMAVEVNPAWHHGDVSGCLSTLHKALVIARLADRRGRCKIYVMPEFVEGRSTERQGRN
jgi:hypothetical protein